MGAVHAGRAGAMANSGWGAAWRARAGNPLPRLWRVTARRRAEGKPWWGRSPGLLLSGALISALTAWLLWLALADFLSVRHSAVASRAAALGYLGAGTAVLLAGALALCLFWLLGRVYSAAHLSLSLLAEGKPGSGETLDRLVGASGLSDREIVLGLLMYTWRLLAPPLIAVSALEALLCAVAVLTDAATRAPAWLIEGVLLSATALCAAQLAGSLAASLAAALLLMVLGRGLRAPLVPALGAAGVVVAQLAVLTYGSLIADWGAPSDTGTDRTIAWLCQLGGLVITVLCAWAALHWRAVRSAVLLLLPTLVVLTMLLGGGLGEAIWPWQSVAQTAFIENSHELLPLRIAAPQFAVLCTNDPYSWHLVMGSYPGPDAAESAERGHLDLAGRNPHEHRVLGCSVSQLAAAPWLRRCPVRRWREGLP